MDAGGAGLVEIVRGVALAAAGKPLPQAREVTDELGMEAIHLELSKYRYCTGFVVEGEHLDSVAARGRSRTDRRLSARRR